MKYQHGYCLDSSHYGLVPKDLIRKSKCKACLAARKKKYIAKIKKRYPERIKQAQEKWKNSPRYAGYCDGNKDAPKDYLEARLALLQWRRQIRKLRKQEQESNPIQLEQEV